MAFRTKVSAALIAGALVANHPECAMSQQLPQINTWQIGNWHGGLLDDRDGFFDKCITYVSFQAGPTLSVSINSRADIQIRFTDDDWTLTPGADYRVQLSVDGNVVVPWRGAQATRPAQLMIVTYLDYRLISALRRGRDLEIASSYVPADGLRLSLVNSSAALNRMAQCIPAAVPRQSAAATPPREYKQVPTRPDTDIHDLEKFTDTASGNEFHSVSGSEGMSQMGNLGRHATFLVGCSAALFGCLTFSPDDDAKAAAICTLTGPSGREFIVVSGELKSGDETIFSNVAEGLDAISAVIFNSPGGTFSVGLAIGRSVRSYHLATIVTSGHTCASSCALAWLGGGRLFIQQGAKVGFHAAYKVDDAGTAQVDGPSPDYS